jgi:hypothetical protein
MIIALDDIADKGVISTWVGRLSIEQDAAGDIIATYNPQPYRYERKRRNLQ